MNVDAALKNEGALESALKQAFGDKILEVKTQRARRMYVRIPPDKLLDVITFLKQKFDMRYLSAISAVDVGDNLDVKYHFNVNFNPQTVTITLVVSVPKDNPEVDSVSLLIPGAAFYEREIQDLMGVKVKNIPDSRRLIIAEDWPQGVYPLRKDFVVPGAQEE